MRVRRLDGDDEVQADKALLRELAWSAALVGGVVAYLIVVGQFAI